MTKLTANQFDLRRKTRWYARSLSIVVALLSVVASGCANLRLPAIDPTGTRIFSPLPTTTSLALPGATGEGIGCLRRIGSGLGGGLGGGLGLGNCIRNFQFPTPAFTDPAAPPQCLVPLAPAPAPAPVAAGIASNEPCVPSEPCSESCKSGPPAVLLGNETQLRDVFKLPTRGNRGCILLSPQKIVAPVGGEVILKSGICGDDGYLQIGQPLEWMLTPDSVGTLLQVGDDDPGFLHRLAKISKVEKKDASYAKGVTSSKRTLITRGNLDRSDDVELEKGQTWITLSSPSEGTSRVTVLAPESECWDNRKATATIYWVDANATFPSAQIESSGTPILLTTRVNRSEGRLPAAGWKVRYEIQDPSLAAFADSSGPVTEVPVDENGNATAELIPFKGASGSSPVTMKVIRPGGATDNIPTLALFSGQTFVTWNAPQLEIVAAGPEIASFGSPVGVFAEVSNPGNQPLNDVRVTLEVPTGVKVTSTDGFAQVLDRVIVWEIGTIPPGIKLDLSTEVTAKAPTQLTFEARGSDGLVAADTVRIDVYRPALILEVQPEKERYESGEPVTFNVDVTNTGERALQDVRLNAIGDGAMVHQVRGGQRVTKPKEDGPLQPGDTWKVAVVFIPTDAGLRCVEFSATASGGQQAQKRSCVTVINPVPPTPALTANLAGPTKLKVGDVQLFRGRITNTGEVPLTDLRTTMSFDPQMELLRRTEKGIDSAQVDPFLIAWNHPTLAPGESQVLEAEFRALDSNPRSQIIMTTRSSQGAAGNDSFIFDIEPGIPPRTGPPGGANAGGGIAPEPDNRVNPGGTLQPTPTIPGGIAPIPDPSRGGNAAPGVNPNAVGPGAGGVTPGPRPPVPNTPTGRLALSLAGQDNPVRVGEPIRYTLRVVNDSTVTNNETSLRFALPAGVDLERVSQRRSPELNEYNVNAGVVYLRDIRSMRPGESIDYELVLSSNQPQTFDLVVEGASQLTPQVQSVTASTTVIP